jgi:hypothetical protein
MLVLRKQRSFIRSGIKERKKEINKERKEKIKWEQKKKRDKGIIRSSRLGVGREANNLTP